MMRSKHPTARALVPLLVIIYLGAALGASAQTNQTLNVDDKNVFLAGYDVVSYYNANQAVQGSARYATEYEGATFHFANPENLAAFSATPVKYLPKYGGYCAFAVANGMGLVGSDPRTFKLYNGELLMFFNDLYEGKPFNTIVPWNADERHLFTQAEKTWPGLNK